MCESFGKHLYFSNYPPSWFSHTVKELQQFPHWSVTKSEILVPSNVSGEDVIDPTWENFIEDEQYDEEMQLDHTKIDHNIRDDDGFEWFLENSHEVKKYFRLDKAEYVDSINKMVAESHFDNIVIEEGKPFDIISLLSKSFCGNGNEEKNYLVRGNGEKVEVESLRGKNILVCCTLVPTLWCLDGAKNLVVLPTGCSVYFSGDYEVVMVVKMRKNGSESGDEKAFNHFLSGFPSTWLAVPFSDILRRDFICKCMGLYSASRCLFLDQNQKVIKNQEGDSLLDDIVYNSFIRCRRFENRTRLDTILECKPTDLISKVNGGDDTVSISELNERLVGLYLCVNGKYISTLNVIYQACKDRHQEFEIVVVYLPFANSISPQVFQDLINQVLDQMKLSASWWVRPFDEFVSCRMYSFEDKLVIVRPHNKFWYPYGKDVIHAFGIDAYPFTAAHVIERFLEELRALTLESLLVHGSPNFVLRGRKRVPVAELQGKIVLLYADYIQSLHLDFYHPLLSWYSRTTQDFEVVFVDLRGGNGNDSSLCECVMPWLTCPFDPLRATFVRKNLHYHCGLAAFGKDGKLISLDAHKLLDSHWPEDFLSYDGLRDEITTYVHSISCHDLTADIYDGSLV